MLEEEIIRIQSEQARKREGKGSLEEGYWLDGTKLVFQRVLLQEVASILLPDTFLDLPEAFRSIKYPMEQRPSLIKSNPDGSVNLTVQILSMKVKEEELRLFIRKIKQMLKKVQPANRFLEEGYEERKEYSVGWFDFISHGFDGKQYQRIEMIPWDEVTLQIGFNCLAEDAEKWKPIAEAILASLERV